MLPRNPPSFRSICVTRSLDKLIPSHSAIGVLESQFNAVPSPTSRSCELRRIVQSLIKPSDGEFPTAAAPATQPPGCNKVIVAPVTSVRGAKSASTDCTSTVSSASTISSSTTASVKLSDALDASPGIVIVNESTAVKSVPDSAVPPDTEIGTSTADCRE